MKKSFFWLVTLLGIVLIGIAMFEVAIMLRPLSDSPDRFDENTGLNADLLKSKFLL